jgi:hypothetical protein
VDEGQDASADYMADRRDEVRRVMGRLIARAWVDPAFKTALIAQPKPWLEAEGLFFPERYLSEIYDDPSAELGDWHSIGRGAAAVHRFPIPAPPPDCDLAADNLEASLGQVACCSPCASCTGAASHATWY